MQKFLFFDELHKVEECQYYHKCLALRKHLPAFLWFQIFKYKSSHFHSFSQSPGLLIRKGIFAVDYCDLRKYSKFKAVSTDVKFFLIIENPTHSHLQERKTKGTQ